MIKAKTITKTGETLFLFGLSEMNVLHLKMGEPIYFAGAELDLPHLHFLIAFIPDGKTDDDRVALSTKVHEKFAKGDPRHLFSMMLTREALDHLAETGGHEIRHPKIPGIVMLVYGKTEQAIVQMLGLPGLAAAEPGFTQRYDPITGAYVPSRTKETN